MKLGAHAFAWCTQWDDAALPIIEHVKHLGLDFIEIPLMKLEGVNPAAIKEKLQSVGMNAITSTLITNPNHDITSEDPEIRASGIEYLKTCIRYTSEMGADFFTGVIHSLHGKLLDHRPTQKHWQYAADSLREAVRYADSLGVKVGIEPINRYETFLINTCDQAVLLKEMIGEPNLKIHLDTYHMNIEEKSMYEAIKAAGSELYHMHLNENDWGIPGSGHVEWDMVFQALSEINYQGYASIECVVDFQGGYVWRQLAPDGDTLIKQGIEFIREMKTRYM